jgi:hypothetical protein
MYLGDKHFWLRSSPGLAIILVLSIVPTFLLANLLGNTSDYMAAVSGVVVAALRMVAWTRWGDGR